MENRFKMRISSMFRSSLASCKSKNINDVVVEKNPNDLPQNRHRQHHQLFELFSPKPRPFSSTCRPKIHLNSPKRPSYTASKNVLPRSKISEREPFLLPPDIDGKKHSPITPVSPVNMSRKRETKPKEKRYIKPTTKKAAQSLNKEFVFQDFNDFPGCNYNGLFSSDEDKNTLFSSRSLSSDSSESFRRNNNNNACEYQKKSGKARRKRAAKKVPERGQRVKGSFAMVKRSSDPYNDFRTSMVEMIVEKQIFAAKDLEKMLQCFLSLNSYHHHRIIIEVFTEIWEALFSNSF